MHKTPDQIEPVQTQTVCHYRERKLQEIEFLNNRLQHQLEIDRQASVAQMIETKLALSAAFLAESIQIHPDLRETNFHPYDSKIVGPYEMRWKYQSSDLAVENQPLLYGSLFEKAGTESLLTELKYFGTGMGGLASLFLALDKVAVEPINLICVRDAYFQTLDILRNLTTRLQLVPLAQSETPDASMQDQHLNAAKTVLFMDSIGEESHEFLLDLVPEHGIALVFFDTTCYLQNSRYTRDIANRILESRIPLVMLRSHQKLDAFGVEWGRLGSSFYVVPDSIDAQQREWILSLSRYHDWVSARIGSGALARSLIAYPLDDAYMALNDSRVEMARGNNQFVFRRLAETLDPERFRVVSFHHNLFGLLEVRGQTDILALQALSRELVDVASDAGVPTTCAATFGFDMIAVDTFFDLGRGGGVGQPTIRISVSDLPTEMVETFCSAAVKWSESYTSGRSATRRPPST